MTEKTEKLIPRPPVVVVMGHVDHGKTSLLDNIRQAHVAAREAGGITQHVSAYEIELQGKKLTFIDTPGHEAFSKIRERGAKLADVAILVIAAEEGLKPQSKEALNFILQSQTPFVIALNKTDLPQANPDKIKQQLAELEVFVEDWGGKVPCLPISAKTGQGIDQLLEMVILMAEMEELKADPKNPAKGYILESFMDPKRGFTATTIILDGTLEPGETICTLTAEAKIKGLEDFSGQRVKSLSFSSPAIITGWNKQPEVGEIFCEDKTLLEAQETPIATEIKNEVTSNKSFALVLKADVSGSLEALEAIIRQLFEELELTPIIQEKSSGPITLSDAKTAESSKAAIINFRSQTASEVKNYLRDREIKVFESQIIYELREKLKEFLEEYFKPETEKTTGKLEILEIFSEKDKKNRQLVGGRLFEGKVKKNQRFIAKTKEETSKETQAPATGKVISLRKNKQELENAEAVSEIGIYVELQGELKKGDQLEFRLQ